jgi:hypothetical protein
MRVLLFLVVTLFLIQVAHSQGSSGCTISIDSSLADTVSLGDTTILARLRTSYYCRGVCPFRSLGLRARPPSDAWIKNNDVYYAPSHEGFDTIVVEGILDCTALHSCEYEMASCSFILLPFVKERLSVANGILRQFSISENGTKIVLFASLVGQTDIHLKIYDLTGRLIRSIHRDVPSGTSEIDLGMSSLPAGCYWYVVRGDGWTKSGKVMKLP